MCFDVAINSYRKAVVYSRLFPMHPIPFTRCFKSLTTHHSRTNSGKVNVLRDFSPSCYYSQLIFEPSSLHTSLSFYTPHRWQPQPSSTLHHSIQNCHLSLGTVRTAERRNAMNNRKFLMRPPDAVANARQYRNAGRKEKETKAKPSSGTCKLLVHRSSVVHLPQSCSATSKYSVV